MKELFRSSDTALIGFYESILDDAEIPHFVRNDTTQQAIVGSLMTAVLPLPEFWPALCVLNDDDYPRAMQLLREVREAGATSGAEWKCAACGETVPGNFTACWNCGVQRAGGPS
jgi:hypothetical protein